MTTQHIRFLFMLMGGALAAAAAPVRAATPEPIESLHYADLADLSLPAQIVAKVRISEEIELQPKPGTTVVSGHVQVYLEADIEALIKGPQDVPRHVAYIADLVRDSQGRPPKIKKSAQLIFAHIVSGRSGFVQLIAPDADLIWSPARESTVRQIITSSSAADSPPRVIGIDSAFSAAGTIPGERETQIFLQTESQPVSITVTRRAGETARWSVALGEIADNGSPPPLRDTLLWYRLACTLPIHMPHPKLAALPADQLDAVNEDYDLVRVELGACERSRR